MLMHHATGWGMYGRDFKVHSDRVVVASPDPAVQFSFSPGTRIGVLVDVDTCTAMWFVDGIFACELKFEAPMNPQTRQRVRCFALIQPMRSDLV
jgi:hypothetical protein